MKLYEIAEKYRYNLARYEEAETQTELDSIALELIALEGEKSEKLSACCGALKGLRAETEAIATEIERLERLREIAEKREQALETYIANCVGVGESWKDALHKISWRKSERVKILDKEAVPGAYLREKLSYEPDLISIKKDLECGADLPWAVIEKRDNVQIK